MFGLRIRVTSVTNVDDWQTEKAKQARKIYAIVCVVFHLPLSSPMTVKYTP
jgi:hypothetical protein